VRICVCVCGGGGRQGGGSVVAQLAYVSQWLVACDCLYVPKAFDMKQVGAVHLGSPLSLLIQDLQQITRGFASKFCIGQATG